MRSRSLKNSMSMEVERPKLKDEPHLSCAYIRSLLSSSKSKTPTNSKSPDRVIGDGLSQDLAEYTECISKVQQRQSPPPPSQSRLRKKQVRRRLHTSRPYQERILNMAEARREIVAALKLHRATMKQANEEQQQNQRQQKQNSTQPSTLYSSLLALEEPHQELTDCRRNARIHPPNYTYPYYYQDPSFSPFLNPSSAWAYPTIPSLSIADHNLNLPLPNKPLGLNLNMQGFNNVDMSFCNSNTNNPPIQLSPPPSSCSSYSDFSPPIVLGLQVPSVSNVAPHASDVTSDPLSMVLHPEMDDEEMAKIRSIGEQYNIEWNDMMNLFTSVWWNKSLKDMEGSPDERMTGVEEDGFHVFDEFLDTPSWLSDGYAGDAKDMQQQQQMDGHYHTEDYLKDVTLPCWDIGEIESWDTEWLS
ncbi:dual specificity protein kinase splA-like [Phoenix dactylifera]|uniref:Dual specificity protein kinase splA-like n=1 Tax=Phoenix dactylifera TaxID=42345 RepID=A0A8B9B3K2_PHODC|nr:dual specificity protein kinase splA-like [Phoenix dactylifera]